VKAQSYSFEAANVRREKKWHVWQQAKLPPGKMLMPSVVSYANNLVERPQLVADRILRSAAIVRRENIIAARIAASAAGSTPTSSGPSCARLSKTLASRRRLSGPS
jgi:5-methyltetrahydropteroyltriglutamate--homocysteine methyltransferase